MTLKKIKNQKESAQRNDTIVANATAMGRGGIGVVRVSGSDVKTIAKTLFGQLPKPRVVKLVTIPNVDEGILLYFAAPNSYTGEDVLEFQGHGGPVIQQQVLQAFLQQGARLAEPGEFTQRAFLNNKMDLTQAEAVADLIDAGSQQAARSALRSLKGEFSNHVRKFIDELIQLRMMIEAAIDFVDEDIDFLAENDVAQRIKNLLKQLSEVYQSAQQGVLLRNGIHIVLIGEPNVGKSSLLNRLSGQDRAIVTEVAGTTRDVLRESINVEGIPLHIIDTAGLRETQNIVEQEGMRRTWQAVSEADVVILISDASEQTLEQAYATWMLWRDRFPKQYHGIILRNKIDLTAEQPASRSYQDVQLIQISAKLDQGLDLLKRDLLSAVGAHTGESTFIARGRHLQALQQAQHFLETAMDQFQQHQATELLAEDLRQAQQALQTITGEYTADDLLGEIFSSFCIGK